MPHARWHLASLLHAHCPCGGDRYFDRGNMYFIVRDRSTVPREPTRAWKTVHSTQLPLTEPIFYWGMEHQETIDGSTGTDTNPQANEAFDAATSNGTDLRFHWNRSHTRRMQLFWNIRSGPPGLII